MGYRWIGNPEPGPPYDLIIFKNDSIRAVKLIQARNRIDPEIFYDKKYREEAEGLRNLPFPEQVAREIWLKSRGEKTYRRLPVMAVGVAEIELWQPDGYVNPHSRKDLPGKRGPTGKFIVSKIPAPRLYPPVDPAPPEISGPEKGRKTNEGRSRLKRGSADT